LLGHWTGDKMSSFVSSFFNVLVGCSHKKTTFPLTQSKNDRKRTYVVCLDCGREFDYSWKQMKLGGEAISVPVPERASVHVAHS